MENLILSELCSALDINILDLDFQASFIQNGGHSLAAAAFASKCKDHGYHITSKSILTSDSIRECISSAKRNTKDESAILHGPAVESSSDRSPELHSETPSDVGEENVVSLEEVAPSLRSSSLSLPNATHISETSPTSFAVSEVSNSDAGSEATSISSESTIDEQDERKGTLTDMQLSLIHGTLKTRGMNIISYSETYFSRDVPTVKMAWKTVLGLEPVFHIPAFEDFRGTEYDAFSWHEERSFFSDEQTRKAVDNLRNTNEIGSAIHVFPQKLAPGKEALSTITWIVHHAFVDGFSASLLLDKVRRVTAGLTVKPGPSFSQSVADLQQLRRSRKREGDDYWSEKTELLSSASSQLLLPVMAESSAPSPSDEVVIDIKSLRSGFKSFSKVANVTTATIFNAAWALVLSKYCDSATIKFGMILSGRDLPIDGVRDIVGPLMNTLPFCIKVDPESSAKSFAQAMMSNTTELREYQWTTLGNGFRNDFESALAVQFDQIEPPKDAVRPIGERLTQQVGTYKITFHQLH